MANQWHMSDHRPRHRRAPTVLSRLMIPLLLVTIALPVLATGKTVVSPGSEMKLIPMESESAQARKALSADALAALKKKIAQHPKDRAARFSLVKALMVARRYKEALRAAKAWRKKDAYNLVVVRLLGDIYSEMGQKAASRRAYSAVVELLPEDHRAHRALATVLKESGNLKGAYTRLKTASSLRPKDVRISFELADVAHRLGRKQEAIDGFKAIINASGSAASIRYPAKQRLAQLYSARRRDALNGGKTSQAKALSEAIDALKIKGGTVNDIKLYLTWDTDRSDVDLHVVTPRGETINYKRRKGKHGGALYDDVTTGYGPESFTAPQALAGTYLIKVHYYGSSRRAFTEARGEVVVVLNEGTARETRQVLPYRFFKVKEQVIVGKIKVSPRGEG